MHYTEAEQSYEHTRVRSIRIFQEQVLRLLSTLRKTRIAILTAQSLEPSQSNRGNMSDIAAGLLPTNHTMLQTSAESLAHANHIWYNGASQARLPDSKTTLSAWRRSYYDPKYDELNSIS
jgi:hypothetical protein